MDKFWFYFDLGYKHVFDKDGLDHFYFLIALCLPFTFKEAKKLFWWISIFTIGHSISLIISNKKIIQGSESWIEFLISITIIFTCFSVILKNKNKHESVFEKLISPLITLIFGLIHGMGFAKYFSVIVLKEYQYSSLFKFALGIEFAQLLISCLILVVNFIVLEVLKISKKVWVYSFLGVILSQAFYMAILSYP
jgi:hypothetical protein